ncbi:MAG: sodium ion-translocating decarboxylase subunit beta [Victivallaceae bacterium]|nr:sodium ion-translocating decarboxylase subunit beta [Victivallaceae bacterium]
MNFDFSRVFQGFELLSWQFQNDWPIAVARIALVVLGIVMVHLGRKGVLEPLLMIPMGLGVSTINAAMMFFDPVGMVNKTAVNATKVGTLFLDSIEADNGNLMTLCQIDWLQPIYTFAFSNGLIACLIFVGIGSLLDVGFVMARPYQSMFIALCAELGTLLTLPIAMLFKGMTIGEAASIALVGGADGPMVLFGSLKMAPELFVPITVVAYLYLALAYGGFPYLIRFMVPKKFRMIEMPPEKRKKEFSSSQKLIFSVVACVMLSFLFPVASPLFFSLFLGIAIRESGLEKFRFFVSEIILYGSTLTLGALLGVLCDAKTIMNPQVLPLLILGIISLGLSAVGGLIGGYLMYFFTGGKYNPVIGIAGVSCVPSTAKVAQKAVSHDNPGAVIMQYALGANICGVITTAIITAAYICLIKN